MDVQNGFHMLLTNNIMIAHINEQLMFMKVLSLRKEQEDYTSLDRIKPLSSFVDYVL